MIATVLRLSDNIAGVTILAFGNGAPDIFTSLVSGADESIIMFTELIGAGIFVTTIIAGSVAVIRPFRVELKFMMRDACFYIVTVFWISFVVRDHRVHLWEAASTYLPPPDPFNPLPFIYLALALIFAESCRIRNSLSPLLLFPFDRGGGSRIGAECWLETLKLRKCKGVTCNASCYVAKFVLKEDLVTTLKKKEKRKNKFDRSRC